MRRVHADLIKRWADDNELEVQYYGYGDTDVVHWCDISDPSWDDALHYRFKPPEVVVGQRYNVVADDAYGRGVNVMIVVHEIDCLHAVVKGIATNMHISNKNIAVPFSRFKSRKVAVQ